jgi:hypothetical protein
MKLKVNIKVSIVIKVMLLLLVSSSYIAAQTDKYVDKIKLNNGSTIWGLSEIKQDQVIIHVNAKDSIIIPAENIKSLKTNKLNPELYQDNLEGLYNQVSTGVLVGSTHQYSGNEGSFSASFVSGYKLKQQFGLGLGVGVDYYPSQRHLPVFLDIQGDLIRGRFTPFYQLNLGYSWAHERSAPEDLESLEGGLYLRPSFGVKWHFARYSWFLKLSYVRQESTTRYEPIDFGNGNTITNVEDRVLQRAGISFGISF